MKVLIVLPLELSETQEYMKNKISLRLEELNKAWKEYQKNHPTCCLNLDFEYRIGSDSCAFYLNSYYYFSEQDIVALENEICPLIEKKEIIGLIMDPILTIKEEEQYIASSYIEGDTLERLFDKFSDFVSIFFYDTGSIGSFYSSPLYNKMKTTYKNQGYDLSPSISHKFYSHNDYEAMFNCFVDKYSKIYDESIKTKTLLKH